MFVRSSFVTNSSSTSFICYGITVGEYEVEEAFNKNNLTSRDSYQVIADKLEEASYFLKDSGSPVRIFRDYQLYHVIFYVEPSYIYLGEGGVRSFPSENMRELLTDSLESKWDKALQQALIDVGVRCNNSPHWQIALSIER